jgi:hypothetical protein
LRLVTYLDLASVALVQSVVLPLSVQQKAVASLYGSSFLGTILLSVTGSRVDKSIAKAMQTQRICRAWGLSFARGFARAILDRVRDSLDQAPGSRNWGSELDADAEFNFFYPPSAGRGRS